jgi:uncharacterized protein (TIGR02117 family)
MRLTWRLLQGFAGLGLLYFLSAITLGLIPVGVPSDAGSRVYDFYACDNGVHVDLVLPAAGQGRDWFGVFPPSDFAGDVTAASHVILGWGAKSFYAATREWSDIRPMPVLKALFWQDSAVLHVSYGGDPAGRANCRRVSSNAAGRDALFAYVDATLHGLPRRGDLPGYGANDAFYEAAGTYSLFRTCNVWTADALKRSGQRMALWSPFSFQIMGLLRPD